MYKIIATCIERATALRAKHTAVTNSPGLERFSVMSPYEIFIIRRALSWLIH